MIRKRGFSQKHEFTDDFDYDTSKDIKEYRCTNVLFTWNKKLKKYYVTFYAKDVIIGSEYINFLPYSIITKMHTLRRVKHLIPEMREALEYGRRDVVARIMTMVFSSSGWKKLFVITTGNRKELSYGVRYYPDDDLIFTHTVKYFIEKIKELGLHRKYETHFFYTKNYRNLLKYIFKFKLSEKISIKLIFQVSLNMALTYKYGEQNRITIRIGNTQYESIGQHANIYSRNITYRDEILNRLLEGIAFMEGDSNHFIDYIYDNKVNELLKDSNKLDRSQSVVYNVDVVLESDFYADYGWQIYKKVKDYLVAAV